MEGKRAVPAPDETTRQEPGPSTAVTLDRKRALQRRKQNGKPPLEDLAEPE